MTDLCTYIAQNADHAYRTGSLDHAAIELFDRQAGIEVFHARDYRLPLAPGFYWWACQPGCLPDSDPVGPFESRVDAARDALDAVIG